MAKKLYLSRSSLDEEGQMMNEVGVLKDINHPHVLKYYDIFLEDDDCLISLL